MSLPSFPPPPPDFNERTLPRFVTQGHWLRLNRAGYDSSLHFDRSGKGRFDEPHQRYGILYVGEDESSAFIDRLNQDLDFFFLEETTPGWF